MPHNGYAPKINPADIISATLVTGLALFPYDQLLIRLDPTIGYYKGKRILRQVGTQIGSNIRVIGYFPVINTFLVKFDELKLLQTDEEKIRKLNDLERQLSAHPDIPSTWIMKNYLAELDDTPDISSGFDATSIKAYTDIGLSNACLDRDSSTANSHFVEVAIVDTGIQISHREFNGLRIYGDTYHESENWTEDTNGHGTQVSGTIIAKNDGRGINGVISCTTDRYKVHTHKITSSTSQTIAMPLSSTLDILRVIFGRSRTTTLGYLLGFRDRHTVVNMSFGWDNMSTPQSDLNQIHAAFGEYMNAYSNILFVSSAGNKGLTLNSDTVTHAPGGVIAPNHITVAATNFAATDLAKESDGNSPFSSNFGSAVTIAAPGVRVLTTGKDNDNVSVSGTSFAAPLVTGSAALLLTVDRELTPEQLICILVRSGDPLVGNSGLVLLRIDNALRDLESLKISCTSQ